MSKSYEELRKDLTKAIQENRADEALRIADLMKAESAQHASTVYLVNIAGNTIHLSTNYGHFWLEGRREASVFPPRRSRPYGVTAIEPMKHMMDIGDDKRITITLSAEEIGRDLERMANADIGEGNSFAGVFLSYTETPSDEDLELARGKYVEQCKAWVTVGDNLWAQSHNYVHIADYMRRAVKELKLEKEWAYEPKEMADCPGCGSKVSPKAAVCSHCFAVLDEKKARQLYPDRFPVRQARSRKPSTEAQPSQ